MLTRTAFARWGIGAVVLAGLTSAWLLSSALTAGAQSPGPRPPSCQFTSISGGTPRTSSTYGLHTVYTAPGATVTLKYTCPAGATLGLVLGPGAEDRATVQTSRVGDEWTFVVDVAPSVPVPSTFNLSLTETTGAGPANYGLGFNTSPPPIIPTDPSIPPRGADCSSFGEPGPGNVTTQLPVEVKRPGESAFTPVSAETMCATVTLRADDGQVGMHIYPGPAVDYKWYPKGTVYRFTGSIPGFAPVRAGGGLKGLKISTRGEQFTIEGEPIEHLFVLDQARKCVPSTAPMTYFVGNMVASNTAKVGSLPPEMTGMAVGSNGTSFRDPYLTANGIAWGAEGCGDNDPETKEGFYDAFIPPALLEKQGGITQEQLNSVGSIKELLTLEDNGSEASGATFTKEAYQDGQIGIRVYYPLSFSSSANGVARARAAQSAQGPSSHTIELKFRNRVAKAPTPVAAAPAKPSVKWKASKKKRTVTATVKLAAGSTVTHAISAKKLRAKKPKSGKCVVDKKKTKATCTVKLSKGRWTVSITPRQGTLAGTASSKTFKF